MDDTEEYNDGYLGTGGHLSSDIAAATGVAAAPKEDSLYESLIRYHNENDSDDSDESEGGGRRRKGHKGVGKSLPTPPEDDRKQPAVPRKKPPPQQYPKQPAPQPAPQPTPPTQTARRGSFYQEALTAAMRDPSSTNPSSNDQMPTRKPGIVQVHEPAVRPDSHLYRLRTRQPAPAAEVSSEIQIAVPVADYVVLDRKGNELIEAPVSSIPFAMAATSTVPRTKPNISRRKDGLSQSAHVPRTKPNISSRRPDGLSQSSHGLRQSRPETMKTFDRATSTPTPYHGTKAMAKESRSEALIRSMHENSARAQAGYPKARDQQHPYDNQQRSSRGVPDPSFDRSRQLHQPASQPLRQTNAYRGEQPYPTQSPSNNPMSGGAPPSPRRHLSNPNLHPPAGKITANATSRSMKRSSSFGDVDEDLKRALEISKLDTGGINYNVKPPRTQAPRPADGAASMKTPYTKQTTLAKAELRRDSSSDVIYAMELSEKEASSKSSQRQSTSIDELLSWEKAGLMPATASSKRNSVMDLVAAGVSTGGQTAVSSSQSGQKDSASADAQMRILEQIRDEQEQKELELALKASQQQDEDGLRRGQTISDFLLSQQQAMQEWSRNNTTQPETEIARQDSAGRRRELLERGTQETQEAILSGKAQIVKCRGCNGRLQAPASYSLVYCPKCQTISPA